MLVTNWPRFKGGKHIIAKEDNRLRRRRREAIENQCQAPTLNRDRGFELPVLYWDNLSRDFGHSRPVTTNTCHHLWKALWRLRKLVVVKHFLILLGNRKCWTEGCFGRGTKTTEKFQWRNQQVKGEVNMSVYGDLWWKWGQGLKLPTSRTFYPGPCPFLIVAPASLCFFYYKMSCNDAIFSRGFLPSSCLLSSLFPPPVDFPLLPVPAIFADVIVCTSNLEIPPIKTEWLISY